MEWPRGGGSLGRLLVVLLLCLLTLQCRVADLCWAGYSLYHVEGDQTAVTSQVLDCLFAF